MNSFEPNKLLNYEDNSLLEELKRVYFKYYNGLQMTTKQFDTYSRVSASTVAKRFGSWFLALEKGDLVKLGAIRNITISEIKKNIERVILLNKGEYFTIDFYRKNGGLYSESTLKKYFENKKWREILFDEFKIYQIRNVIVVEKEIKKKTEEQLFDEIKKVWNQIGRRPTYSEFREKASFGTKIYEKKYGSWTKAIEAFCMINNNYQSSTNGIGFNTTKELLIQELQKIVQENNLDILNKGDYEKYGGKYTIQTFYNHFGSWKNAKITANLKIGRTAPEKDQLFDELQRVWEELGRQPTQDEITKYSKYKYSTYKNIFGGWTKAIYAFIADRKKEDIEEELEEKETASININQDQNTNKEQPIGCKINLDNIKIIKMKTSRKVGNHLRFRVLNRDNFTCQYCGKKGEGANLEADHIIAYSKGGETILENLTTACWTCNNGKSNITL